MGGDNILFVIYLLVYRILGNFFFKKVLGREC